MPSHITWWERGCRVSHPDNIIPLVHSLKKPNTKTPTTINHKKFKYSIFNFLSSSLTICIQMYIY